MNVRIVLTCALAFAVCCSAAQAYTLRFDDIPSGSGLDYYKDLYGVTFTSGFSVIDHAGSKALTWTSGSYQDPRGFVFADGFSNASAYYPLHYTARSVGAFFSTDTDVMIRMIGYSMDGAEVGNVLIGRPEESWNGRYVEISSEAGDIGLIMLEVVDLPPSQYGFCADDITVEPVPEPSALAAMFAGLVGCLWHRKKQS